MFFDPSCQPEVKPETKPSMAGLVAWLETQDPTTTYDFDNCQGFCLIGQYMAHIGIRWGSNADQTDSTYMETCGLLKGRWDVSFALDQPWTFGGALARARALL